MLDNNSRDENISKESKSGQAQHEHSSMVPNPEDIYTRKKKNIDGSRFLGERGDEDSHHYSDSVTNNHNFNKSLENGKNFRGFDTTWRDEFKSEDTEHQRRQKRVRQQFNAYQNQIRNGTGTSGSLQGVHTDRGRTSYTGNKQVSYEGNKQVSYEGSKQVSYDESDSFFSGDGRAESDEGVGEGRLSEKKSKLSEQSKNSARKKSYRYAQGEDSETPLRNEKKHSDRLEEGEDRSSSAKLHGEGKRKPSSSEYVKKTRSKDSKNKNLHGATYRQGKHSDKIHFSGEKNGMVRGIGMGVAKYGLKGIKGGSRSLKNLTMTPLRQQVEEGKQDTPGADTADRAMHETSAAGRKLASTSYKLTKKAVKKLKNVSSASSALKGVGSAVGAAGQAGASAGASAGAAVGAAGGAATAGVGVAVGGAVKAGTTAAKGAKAASQIAQQGTKYVQKKFTERVVDTIKKAFRAVAEFATRAVGVIATHPIATAVVVACILIVLFLMGCCGCGGCSCFSVGITTYTASDETLLAIEEYYSDLESELYSTYGSQAALAAEYPGYDSYVFNIDSVGHNPYSLASYLQVKLGDYSFSYSGGVASVPAGAATVSNVSSARNQLVSYATDFLDMTTHYQIGGRGYEMGPGYSPNYSYPIFDCSGFTQYVYLHALEGQGISVNFNPYPGSTDGEGGWDVGSQMNYSGAMVVQNDTSSMKPGDLIFFATGGQTTEATHVGMYIGSYGGYSHAYIQSSSDYGKVVVSDYDADSNRSDRPVLGVRRYIFSESEAENNSSSIGRASNNAAKAAMDELFELQYSVTTEDTWTTETHTMTNEDGEEVTETVDVHVLTVTVVNNGFDEVAESLLSGSDITWFETLNLFNGNSSIYGANLTSGSYYGVTGGIISPDGMVTSSVTGYCWPLDANLGSSISQRTGGSNGHLGTDIACSIGTPVRAAWDGVVSKVQYYSGWIDDGSIYTYGNMIVIDHVNDSTGSIVFGTSGYMQTRYAHLSEIYVAEGDYVEKGTIIGASGNTGHVLPRPNYGDNPWYSGAHLHYEVIYNYVRKDGMRWYPDIIGATYYSDPNR